MQDRIKDLKTTVPGLIIGLALIAAALYTMRVQPDWDWKAITGFIGGLASIVVGALVRSEPTQAVAPAAPAMQAPAVPSVDSQVDQERLP